MDQTRVKCKQHLKRADGLALERRDCFNETSIWDKLVLASTHPRARDLCFSGA